VLKISYTSGNHGYYSTHTSYIWARDSFVKQPWYHSICLCKSGKVMEEQVSNMKSTKKQPWVVDHRGFL